MNEELKTNEGLITDEQLIAFAKERLPRDEEVKSMLLEWCKQQEVPEGQNFGEGYLIRVAVNTSIMKYILGFITKEEVIRELNEIDEVREYSADTVFMSLSISERINDIEDGFIKPIFSNFDVDNTDYAYKA